MCSKSFFLQNEINEIALYDSSDSKDIKIVYKGITSANGEKRYNRPESNSLHL